MLCEVEGCDRKAKTFRYGNLCLMHYKRYVRHGDVNDDGKSIKERALQRANSKCKYCDDKIGKYGALGMCCKHYQMYRLHGDALYYDKKPRSTNSHGYYRVGKRAKGEHRKVYEDYYHVQLTSGQVVHHINFIKTDNRIENLYLYNSRSEHARVHALYNRLRREYPAENIEFRTGTYYAKNV